MSTTVFLVRHGVTQWHEEGRVLGQRDLPMSEAGLEQAQRARELLRGTTIVDVVSSPLQRAFHTAELIAEAHGLQPARDNRLTDFRLGQWQGMPQKDIASDPLYQRFLANPLSQEIPGGETLGDILRRARAAVEQAVADSKHSDSIAIVTHAGIIRVLLCHYLGSPPANYHLLRVSPGSVSVLHFEDLGQAPRVLATNYGIALEQLLGPSS